jgi:hypothetical protein
MILTSHLPVGPRLRMSGAITLLYVSLQHGKITLLFHCCLCPFWFSLCSLNRTVLPQLWRSVEKKKKRPKLFMAKHMKILHMWFTNADVWAHEIRCYVLTRTCMFWFTQFQWCKECHRVCQVWGNVTCNKCIKSKLDSFHTQIINSCSTIFFAYLLTNGLFNGSVGSSDNIALNNSMISK